MICNKIMRYKSSKSENITRNIFESIYNTSFNTCKPSWLVNPCTNKQLELDGYNKELKIAFEYNGSQHYTRNYHGSSIKYIKQVYRDHIKYRLCKDNGIYLIVIPNSLFKHEDIRKYVVKRLPEVILNYNIREKNNYRRRLMMIKNDIIDPNFVDYLNEKDYIKYHFDTSILELVYNL